MKFKGVKILFSFLGIFTAILLLFRHKAIAQVISEYLVVTVILFFFCICGDCRSRQVSCTARCTATTACNGSDGCGGICTNNCNQCTPTVTPTPTLAVTGPLPTQVNTTPAPTQTGPYSSYTVITTTTQSNPYTNTQSTPYVVDCLPAPTAPVPSLYPTIAITGFLKIDNSLITNRCDENFTYTGSTAAYPELIISPGSTAPAAATAVCDPIENGDISYSCRISLNNQIDKNINPVQTVTLNTTRIEGLRYRIHWLGPCTINNCTQSTNCHDVSSMVLTVDASKPNPYFNRNIILSADDGWFKLKNTSFNNNNQRSNVFPLEVLKFDDIDDEATNKLIVGDGGLVTTNSTFGLLNTSSYSTNGWSASSYPTRSTFANVSAYTTHLTEKLSNNEMIDVTNDLTLIERSTTKRIFKYNGNLTINSTTLPLIDKRNLVIVVNGEVDFNLTTGIFNPTNSIAIVATSIKFYNKNTVTTPYTNWTGAVSSAKGIFIADEIDFGHSMDIPIKITGNLISLGSVAVPNNRKNIDYRKPSIFVVFDPKIYLDTISSLGLKTFDWQQK